MGLDVKLKIEPCLFEWTRWYVGHMPYFMTKEEFRNAGFNIDESYQPLMSLEDLREGESIDHYYQRSYQLMLHLIKESGKACIAMSTFFISWFTSLRVKI